jgi:hypothetical protein
MRGRAWVRKLVAGLAARKPEINCRKFYVGFVVDNASLNESFSTLQFLLCV